jgi:hypothetical protein
MSWGVALDSYWVVLDVSARKELVSFANHLRDERYTDLFLTAPSISLACAT